MKNVLIVSDAFLDGGLETRITEQVHHYHKNGYKVFLAAGKIKPARTEIFDGILSINYAPCYHNGLFSTNELIIARDSIIDFCLQNSIDFIECHPFWCGLPAILAAEKTPLPISFTLHGIASANFISMDLLDVKILYYICFKYGIDKIYAVAEYLQELYSYLSTDISICRNGTVIKHNIGINTKKYSGRFAIASRLDAPKTILIQNFLSIIHDLPEVTSIDIYGDGNFKDTLQQFLKKNKMKKVTLKGWQEKLSDTFASEQYDAAFGMGRVILDIINAGITAGVLGYGGFAGFVNHDALPAFMENNLTSWESLDNAQIKKLIHELSTHHQNKLSNKDIAPFDNQIIWENHIDSESKIIAKPKPAIRLLNELFEESKSINLYSDILNIVTKHLNLDFDIPLQFLIQHIQEKTKLNNYNHQLQTDLSQITESGFWKTTAPIRKILNILHH